MTGYLCATPYHILAATALASGLCKDDENILVVLDHFDFDETVAEKIRKTGIFDKVILYKSNKKTKLNNVKRLVSAFFPPRLIKNLAKTDFDRFFCFALDFIDITYIKKKLDKRGVGCEFAFADDGLGSYLNDAIYKPRPVSKMILKLSGRYSLLDTITRLYVYKPDYVVTNKQFTIEKIPQDVETANAQRSLCNALWPLDESSVDIDGKILYFEQPYANDPGDVMTKKEQNILKTVMKTASQDSRIKMHPRSFGDSKWQDFSVIETKMPMESMLLQARLAPLAMMTNYSTASFGSYLIDGMSVTNCKTVLLCNILGSTSLSEFIKQFIDKVNTSVGRELIFMPKTESELEKIFSEITKEL